MAKIGIDLNTGSINRDSEEIIIGIDLGTTNSLVAVIKDGNPEAIVDPYGDSTLLPSILHFGKDIITIGHRAKELGKKEPHRTIYSVKRLLGKTYRELKNDLNKLAYKVISPDDGGLVKVNIDEKYYSPVQLSSLILKGLKDRVEGILNHSVSKAVITVPAYFNDIQRQATRDAGKLAGLDVLRIINEPTAASLAYGLGRNNEEAKTIAVFDLGGGTFDVSILHLDNGIFEVISTNGDTNLGGDDIDDIIMDHWEDLHELIPTDLEYVDFRALAQSAKLKLTNEDSFQQAYQDVVLDMDRALLEKLMQPLLDRMKSACNNAVQDAEFKLDEIDEVLLVGGSTRMPIVKKMVQDFFHQKPNDSLNPDEAVALGAAIQADVLGGNRKDILLLDVTPLSLGIETVGGLMDVIIPRNSKVPHSAGRNYTTSVDGQTKLKVAIYQGERDLIENNRQLGQFILDEIPPMAARLPKLLIKFILNADGILEVSALEERSGKEQSITIKSMYEISDEAMAEMLMDSVQNAEEDMIAKALIETRTEAFHLSQSTVKFLNQNVKYLPMRTQIKIQDFVMDLNVAISKMDKDEMEQIMDELNTFANPIAEKMLDQNINTALRSKHI